MEEQQIEFVKQCIKTGIHSFYNSPEWKQLRLQVLRSDKYECQICKRKGKYTRATTVHHVNYVKTHPELALEKFYTWKGKQKRNLISLCHECHEEVHGYRKKEKTEPLTEERWD
ncbi:MAG: HNH endonuclease [Lachnospiraceae bacterium]